jgi:ATPase subunit of ABC transporter with duplicated ATPase domains
MQKGVMFMFIFKGKGLAKDWEGQTIFENIDIEITKGDHIALFGRNGIGKTTLLNGLLGKSSFDKGTLQCFVPREKWGWLDQDPQVPSSMTAMDYVQNADEARFRLKQQLVALEQEMQHQKAEGIWEKYSDIYDRFLQMDGYSLETDAEKAFKEVGLEAGAWETPFNQLSGGQKTKVQFARIMMKNPEFIILDEPTNHLDAYTLGWLENWLRNYQGAVLYVSHDRYFLDQTAQKIIELSKDGSRIYPGGYTAYREQKEVERRTQEMLYKKQEQKKKALLEVIDRYQKWFHVAHAAAGNDHFLKARAKKNVSRFHAKEAELERLEGEMAKKPKDARNADMRLMASEFSAKTIIRIENLTFNYGEQTLFSNLNLMIHKEDRIALIGPNGAGKSTLLKLITGALYPTSGKVQCHPQTKIGYFAQELDNLDDELTILDSLLTLPNMTQTEARTILGSFLFPKEDVFKRIGDLSMGERCRVAFLKLYFSEANLLVLDEPTNFLDVDTREVVEDVLQSYPGAILVVSHDRYFVQKLANRMVKLSGGKMIDYAGSFDEFEAFERRGRLDPSEQAKENTVVQLELQLTQLLVTDGETMTTEEHADLLTKIKYLRNKINEVKSK